MRRFPLAPPWTAGRSFSQSPFHPLFDILRDSSLIHGLAYTRSAARCAILPGCILSGCGHRGRAAPIAFYRAHTSLSSRPRSPTRVFDALWRPQSRDPYAAADGEGTAYGSPLSRGRPWDRHSDKGLVRCVGGNYAIVPPGGARAALLALR